MNSSLSRVVDGLARDADDARGRYQTTRQRLYDLLDAEYADCILPESRHYGHEGDTEGRIVAASRAAEDTLRSGGTEDEAARAASLELGSGHTPMIHEWIAERTAERVEA